MEKGMFLNGEGHVLETSGTENEGSVGCKVL